MSVLVALEPGDQSSIGNDSPAARIDRLLRAKVIPREVAACMRTITEIRNATEYEAKTSQARTAAVEGALLVIGEWADEHGIALPDVLRGRAGSGSG